MRAIAIALALAALPSHADELAVRIVGEALTAGRTLEYVDALTQLGPRSTGTPACQQAQTWAADQLKALGYQPRQEPYPLDLGGGGAALQVQVTEPVKRALAAVAFPGSGGTAQGGAFGELVDLGDASVETLRGLAVKLPGAVGYLRPAKLHESLADAAARLDELLQSAGAVGLLVRGSDEAPRPPADQGRAAKLPQAVLGKRDSDLLERLLKRGPVQVLVEADARAGVAAEAANVVADLPGTASDEVVVVHAHLDSVAFSDGASDNAAGVAAVLEAARLLKLAAARPRRTIRFALMTGEEQGNLGSYAYVAKHRAELARHAAALTMDTGSGRALGLSYFGRAELAAVAQEATSPLARAGLGAAAPAPEDFGLGMSSDAQAFYVAGVPSFLLAQVLGGYLADHHRSTDTADKVLSLDLAYDAAVLALAALQLANHQGSIGRHLPAAEVRAALAKAKQLEAVAAPGKALLK